MNIAGGGLFSQGGDGGRLFIERTNPLKPLLFELFPLVRISGSSSPCRKRLHLLLEGGTHRFVKPFRLLLFQQRCYKLAGLRPGLLYLLQCLPTAGFFLKKCVFNCPFKILFCGDFPLEQSRQRFLKRPAGE